MAKERVKLESSKEKTFDDLLKESFGEKLLDEDITPTDVTDEEGDPDPLPSSVKREQVHQSRSTSRMPEHVDSHDAPRKRTRRRKHTVYEDMFYVPVEEIPEGLSYEWKRWSNAGEHNPFYIAQMREQGWEPVPPKRHPSWVPPGYNEPHIIKNGLILMDRPMELTEEARREQRQLAIRQVREAEQRLGRTPDGQLTRDHDAVRPRISKEYVRAIPVED